MDFKPLLNYTAIGSFPLQDPKDACSLVLERFPKIPFWPQLPQKSFREGMLYQFTEGMPSLQVTSERLYFSTDSLHFHEELTSFYDDYLAITEERDLCRLEERFGLSHDYASSFHILLELLTENFSSHVIALKGHVTGPFTLSLGLTDEKRVPAFYNAQLRDIITKTLGLKARYQIEKLKDYKVPVIVFIDEPGLSAFGTSTFISIVSGDIQRMLSEIINDIHSRGALAGIHCCENTDWSLILESEVDILSFDAYGFFDKLLLYPEELRGFLARGGIMAWGIIPTDSAELDSVFRGNAIVDLWKTKLDLLLERGLGEERKIITRSLITPSCGLGSLSPDLSLKVLDLTERLSRELQREYLLT